MQLQIVIIQIIALTISYKLDVFNATYQVLIDAAPMFADLSRAEQELVEWCLAERKKAKTNYKSVGPS